MAKPCFRLENVGSRVDWDTPLSIAEIVQRLGEVGRPCTRQTLAHYRNAADQFPLPISKRPLRYRWGSIVHFFQCHDRQWPKLVEFLEGHESEVEMTPKQIALLVGSLPPGASGASFWANRSHDKRPHQVLLEAAGFRVSRVWRNAEGVVTAVKFARVQPGATPSK